MVEDFRRLNMFGKLKLVFSTHHPFPSITVGIEWFLSFVHCSKELFEDDLCLHLYILF